MSSIENLKKLIRSLLMSNEEGVSENQFQSEYKSLTMKTLVPQKYGFKTVMDLMRSMPDVVRISHITGTIVFHVVSNSDTANIQRHVSQQKRKKVGKSTVMPCHSTPSYSGMNPILFTRHAEVVQDVKSSPTRVSHVVKNRIKSILSTHNTGISSQTFRELYAEAYGTQLSNSIFKLLISGSLMGVAKVEKLTSNQGTEHIIYPLCHSGNVIDKRQYGKPDLNNNEVVSIEILKDRVTWMLETRQNGISFSEIKQQYIDKFQSEIPDSFLEGIVSGQIKNVARTEKCGVDDSIVTLFPVADDSSILAALNRLTIGAAKQINSLPTNVEKRILPIISRYSDGITLNGLCKIYSDLYKENLTPEQINYIEQGCLEGIDAVTFLSGEVKISLKSESKAIQASKYPSVSDLMYIQRLFIESSSETEPKDLCLRLNSLQYGKVVYLQGNLHFCLQLHHGSDFVEKLHKFPHEKLESIINLKLNSFVLVDGKRAKVLSVSQDHVNVLFIDYGWPAEVQRSKIYRIPKGFREVPQLSLLCYLGGIRQDHKLSGEASRRALDNCLHNKIIIEVISTQFESIDDRLCRVHVVRCYAGNHNINQEVLETINIYRCINVNPVQEKSKSDGPSVDNAYTRVANINRNIHRNSPCMKQPEQSLSVKIVRVVGPDEFYMIPLREIEYLHDLTGGLTEYFSLYRNEDACISPNVNGLYAAFCQGYDSVHTWKRVLVKQIHNGHASVHLIDEGTVDAVEIGSFKLLPHNLANIPRFTMQARLGGIVLDKHITLDVLKHFEKLILGSTLNATIQVTDASSRSDAPILNVTLSYIDENGRDRCINDVLVNEWGIACYKSP